MAPELVTCDDCGCRFWLTAANYDLCLSWVVSLLCEPCVASVDAEYEWYRQHQEV